MSDLVRFGVAMDRVLLADFDRRIASQGYENRSEALRDLVRADLTRAAWEGGAVVAAVITVVYTPGVQVLVHKLAAFEHGTIVSSLHVHLDAERCLEVFAAKGRGTELSSLAGQISGTRGVLSCELTLASTLGTAERTRK